MSRIRVFAPATVSNVGPGFDVLGFAMQRPGDTVDAELTQQAGVELVEVTGDGGQLPRSASVNSAGVDRLRYRYRAGDDHFIADA